MGRYDPEIPDFQLPQKLEKFLAALSTYFGGKDKSLLQRILINSRYTVNEGTDYSNWDGGSWGHTIIFEVPPSLYYQVFDNLADSANEICSGLNKLANVNVEYIATVVLEIQDDESLENWRENSGLRLSASPLAVATSESDLRGLWEPGCLRVFLSHKAQFKIQMSELKHRLLGYGLSAFVAHEDIEPSKEWQDEIEKALFSMQLLVPLLTDGFHDSNWTDQEIGVAIGRGVPVIPVRLGTDPYGFIGKYQAVSGDLSQPLLLSRALVDVAAIHPSLEELTMDALMSRFEQASSFDEANTLVQILDSHLKTATPDTIKRLESARDSNSQVRGAFKVQSILPGLLKRLKQ